MKLFNFVYGLFFYVVVNTMAAESKFRLEFQDDTSEVDCKNGTKMTSFVCLSSGYYKDVTPRIQGEGTMQINSSMVLKKVRKINVIQKYMTVDIALYLYWIDNRITKKFTKENMKIHKRGQSATLVLPIQKLDEIWSPDFYIYDMKQFESYKVISSVNSISILYNYYWAPTQYAMEYTKNNTVIQYILDARAKVYCFNFTFDSFPFEENKCTFLLGTAMHPADFKWGEDGWTWDYALNKVVSGYRVTKIEWINEYPGNVNTEWYGGMETGMETGIGFRVYLNRKVTPFAIQYYIPCAAIVMLTQISFIVPISAIPGRVALLVTEFLTLINIFIHQQVNSDYFAIYLATFIIILPPECMFYVI